MIFNFFICFFNYNYKNCVIMGNKICSCHICEEDKNETNILSQGNNLKREDVIDNNNLQKELISNKRNEKESNLTSRNRNSSNSTEIPDKNYLFNNNLHNSNSQSRNLKIEQNYINNDCISLNNKTKIKDTIKDPNIHFENYKDEIKRDEESPKNKSIISSLTSSKNQYGNNTLKNSNHLNSHMNSDFSIYKVNGVQSNENIVNSNNNNKKQKPLTCQDLLNAFNGNDNKEDEKEKKIEKDNSSKGKSNISSKACEQQFTISDDNEFD